VVLGRLDPAAPIAGGLRLDAGAARAALRRVAGPFRSLRAAAEGIVAVANEEMVRAIRVVSVEYGHDPRDFDLVAFGGAGPLHACDIADLLGMRAVVIPAAGGVLSALGIAAGNRRTDAVESVMQPLARWRPGRLRGEAECELRYRGQAHELSVPVTPRSTLAERFHARHRERYGFADPDGEIEVVSVRVTTMEPGPQLELRRMPRTAPVKGPASVPLDGATMWVGEGWAARRRPDGSWRLIR
jgi:N-methylhydantoinase A/oxoprolinase/acetone carboxylase beta subunit